MADVKAIAFSYDNGLPARLQHFYPPFPRASSSTLPLEPFHQWHNPGIFLSQSLKNSDVQVDARGHSTVPNPSSSSFARMMSEKELQAAEKKARALQSAKLGVRLPKEDCWKIGDPDANWREPAGTSRSDYDPCIPPFTRLISATRDFLNSRHEEFQSNRNKRLMDLIRSSWGLRTDYKGPHLGGSGYGAKPYEYPSSLKNSVAPNRRERNLAMTRDAEDEACALLCKPVASVRGLLATVRSKAEAGWNIEPAIRLARIASAFVAYLVHHGVVSELHSEFEEASRIARQAVIMLEEAKKLENVLCGTSSFNRSIWAVFGGEWSGPERGGIEKEIPLNAETMPVSLLEDEDDGGWVVDNPVDLRPEAIEGDQVVKALQHLIAPIPTLSIRMMGYIPYSRRKIISVKPGSAGSTEFEPAFMRDFIILVTKAAPWTEEERWSAHRHYDNGDSDSESDANEQPSIPDLEQERATVTEPDLMEIRCEPVQGLAYDSMIGMGLRGRWALFGRENGDKWWTFKAKDYILPAFWQSSEVENGHERNVTTGLKYSDNCPLA